MIELLVTQVSVNTATQITQYRYSIQISEDPLEGSATIYKLKHTSCCSFAFRMPRKLKFIIQGVVSYSTTIFSISQSYSQYQQLV